MTRRATVLIADNDEANVQLLTDICEGEDLEVQVAQDGEETLSSVRSTPPDLVLLDVMMPLMDGFEVLEALRADGATRGLPVILVTAVSDDDSIRRGYALGANDYITKPFKVAELVARMRSLISASAYAQLDDEQLRWQVGDRETLERELARSQDGEGDWSLVLFKITCADPSGNPCSDSITERLGEKMAKQLRRLVRGIDSAFLLQQDVVALLLSDTGRDGAETVARRMEQKVSPQQLGKGLTLSLTWSVSTQAGGTEPAELINGGLSALGAP